jgi:hypothetical protein
MSNYVKATDFAAKDALVTGNPSKAVTGTALGAEFDAIATMSATKLDSTLAAPLKLTDGTAAAPSLTFINSPTTGLYRGGADILGVSTAGTSRLTISAAGAFAFAGAISTTAAVTLSPASANIIISPTGTGTVTMAPATASTINNCSIGQTTPLAGSFTTLSASSTVSGAGFTSLFASPPAIGGTVAAAGTFTTLTATGAITHNTTTNSQSYITTGAGTITLTSGTAGAINNMTIGATTPLAGTFTTATANSFIPNSATVPTNGMYLSAANTIAFSTASTSRLTCNSTGAWNMVAPTAGAALTIGNVAGSPSLVCTGGASTTPVALTFSAAAGTMDASQSNVFTLTMTGIVTAAYTISGQADGQTINWFITQDASGSRTMVWPATFLWDQGSTPGTLTTTANAVDLVVMTWRAATSKWYASLAKKFA